MTVNLIVIKLKIIKITIITGDIAEKTLDKIYITVNKNTIPNETENFSMDLTGIKTE